jgi:hypothetical protein
MPENERVIMLPLGHWTRRDGLATFGESRLAVLPVLIAHENARDRRAFPSLDRLATLSGVGKKSVSDAISGLCGPRDWLSIEKQPLKNGRAKNIYLLQYRQYSEGNWSWPNTNGTETTDERTWIAMGRAVVERGVWAAMPHSARRLYLTFKSFTFHGSLAEHGWLDKDDLYDVEAFREEDGKERFDFLPQSALDKLSAEFMQMPGRTFRDARAWLLNNRLMEPTDGDMFPGLKLPIDPRMWSSTVMETLERRAETKKIEAGACQTPAGKRRWTAIRKAAGKAARRGGVKNVVLQYVE